MIAPAPSATLDLPREEILSRLRAGIVSARSDVAGIIVIGSFARGEAWRDLDVVVVLETLEGGAMGWVETALALSSVVALDARVDILPYSKRGFLRSLRNHIPFLLDVAMDGIIVYDRGDLTEALAETRRYIQERGIRRTSAGGWQFPVLYRQNTRLSERGNEEFVRLWLADAERDAEAAQALRERGIHDRSVYHCQQSVERAVKAVLACFGMFERIHFVGRKLNEAIQNHDAGDFEATLRRLGDIAVELEEHVSRSRYIIQDEEGEDLWIPAEHYSDAESALALGQAREALQTAREFAAWWFAPDDSRA